MRLRSLVALCVLGCIDATAPLPRLELRVLEPLGTGAVSDLDTLLFVGEATAEDLGLVPDEFLWWTQGAVERARGRTWRTRLPSGVHTVVFHARVDAREDSVAVTVQVLGGDVGNVLWAVPVDNDGEGLSIGLDGSLYTIDDDGIVAISASGAIRWRSALPVTSVRVQPVVGEDGTLYLSHWGGVSSRGGVVAMDPGGSIRWIFSTDAHGPAGSAFYHVHGAPALGSDGTLYFTSEEDDAPMYAVRADGSLKWRVATRDTLGVLRFTGPTALIGDSLAVSLRRGGLNRPGRLYAITTDSGVIRWIGRIGDANGAAPGVAIGADGHVYVATVPGYWASPCPGGVGTCYTPAGNLGAFSAEGDSLWAREYSWAMRAGSPTVAQGRIHLANELGGVRVYSTATGDSVGMMGRSSGTDQLGAAVTVGRNGVVYTAVTDTLFSYDADGSLRYAVPVQHQWIPGFSWVGGPVLGADGTVYLRTSHGGVIAIRDTVGPSTSPDWPIFQGDFQRRGRR